ncbi:hypothetical protein HK102_001479 [Quaeritorhiza haematococci]|nr:hypothetical protein HK102_001479 [Quaeritorhiza haematococci]
MIPTSNQENVITPSTPTPTKTLNTIITPTLPAPAGPSNLPALDLGVPVALPEVPVVAVALTVDRGGSAEKVPESVGSGATAVPVNAGTVGSGNKPPGTDVAVEADSPAVGVAPPPVVAAPPDGVDEDGAQIARMLR